MDSRIEAGISIDNEPEVRGVLTIETERIDVTLATKSEPDMEWEYVDRAHHFHAYTEAGELPTLDTRTEHVPCGGHGDGDCCEGYDITVYHCAVCLETIEPKVITYSPINREYAPGLTSWMVEVAARVERGEHVSVRVTAGQRVYFGVGVAHNSTAEAGPDGIRFTTWIHGISPLGRRKARAKAAP